MISRTCRLLGILLLNAALLMPLAATAERVKDIASIAGVRTNQLVGYGLVVGLDRSGDRTTDAKFTLQSFRSHLANLGVVLPPTMKFKLENVAAVALSAELPPFAKPGTTIDVTVSSLGNAKSLRGGTLLMTPLLGANGEVYAMAQGNLVVGGLGAEGDASSVTVNIPSVGRIPSGATVEREVDTGFDRGDYVVLNLGTPDFTTAQHLADAINQRFGSGLASAEDAGSVRLRAPRSRSMRVGFNAAVEELQVEPGKAPARVIVNARTGTVVISENVRVMPAAVSHGSITVRIEEQPEASQPNPQSFRGETVVVPRTTIDIEQPKASTFYFAPGVSLRNIVDAINRVGASPQDLVSILEALKAVGALRAQLIVI